MSKKKNIKVGLIVDDGNLKNVAKNSKKAGDALGKTATNARTADRNIKGAAQASSGASKNFSKLAQGTGGLVGAYATLAANVFAISAAFNFLKRAGDLGALTRGQEAFAIKTGKSLSLLTSRVQEATGGLLTFDDASQAVAIGTAAGLSSDQLESLATVAKNASVALGRDLTDSFNRLTRGAIKAEPELLDELGIVLRLEKATEDYARVINKGAKELTQFEKTQAVVNAVLEQGISKFDDVGTNVNQVARLGKAFDDLLKKLSKIIEPFATFISGALVNNVEALAAAFFALGLSITRAILPAMPALESLDDIALSAKERLMGAAAEGDGKLAQNIRSGNIGTRELNAIDRGAGAAGGSTVINQSALTRTQFTKDTNIMRAQHAKMVAENSKGFKRYRLLAVANIKMLQAEHGKAMGLMKAGAIGFSKVASAAFSAIAFIGILTTAVALVRQMVEHFKDPAIKKLEEQARNVSSAFEEQNDKLRPLVENFEQAATLSETIVKQANVLSNFSFKNVQGMAEKLQDATTKTEGAVPTGRFGEGGGSTTQTVSIGGTTQDIISASRSVIQSLTLQTEALQKFGLTAEGTLGAEQVQRVNNLNRALQLIDAKESTKSVNEGIELLRKNLDNATKSGTALSTALGPKSQAIQGIKNIAEGFEKFQESLKHSTSMFSSFLSFSNQLTTSLNQLAPESGEEALIKFMDPGTLADIKKLLVLSNDEIQKGLTINGALALLEKQRADIRDKEFKIVKKSLQTEELVIKASRGKTELQMAFIKNLATINKTNDSILKLEAQIAFQKSLGAKEDATKTAEMQLQLNVLRAQLETQTQLIDGGEQLAAAFREGLSSSMVTNVADLIKGNEASLKSAMLKIAKSALEATADKLAEQFVLPITEFLFGKDPNVVALESNTAAIMANTAAITGVSPSGATVPTISGTNTPIGIENITKELTGDGSGTSDITEIIKTGQGNKGIFGGFISSLRGIFSGETPFLKGLQGIFKGALGGFENILGGLVDGLFGSGSTDGLFGFISGLFGGASGGIMTPRGKMSGYSTGGIARGSQRGYPAILHGTEAIVPLPNGKSIPVDMKGASTQNNIVVNVSADGRVNTEGSTGPDMDQMGTAIAKAVQIELQNQKRSGGMLSPYGPA